ncbi:MAG: SDR family oxidoreductase, partial [Gemmatimonadetes bacterium]|nr:SDR family oxidoreductase [Gemmatimonadota bacterium]
MRAGSLSNKTVVITGASAGLGATLAVECAQQGARLVLLARNAERLGAVAQECEQLGSEVLTVVGNVAIAEDGKRLVEAAIERFGHIDYLVANAGVSMWTAFAAIEDVTLFRTLMEVNYLGAVHCVHPALSHLKESKGLFVVISSIQGQVGVPLHTGYSASKHALQGFCDALRMEVAESGVEVMTVLLHWLKGTELRQRALGRDG